MLYRLPVRVVMCSIGFSVREWSGVRDKGLNYLLPGLGPPLCNKCVVVAEQDYHVAFMQHPQLEQSVGAIVP